MDIWHKITTWTDHNRYLIAGVALAVSLAAWAIGCEVTTDSMTRPGVQVTAPEIEREAIQLAAGFEKRRAAIAEAITVLAADQDTAAEQLDAAVTDLQTKAAKQQEIFNVVGQLAASLAGGTFNPVAAVGSGVTLAGLFAGGGALLDNRRKDKLIQKLKDTTA